VNDIEDSLKSEKELRQEIELLKKRLGAFEESEIQWKEAEKALKASEKEFRAVVEIATELICRYKPDTTLTFINEAYCRYYCMKRTSLLGKSFLPFNSETEQRVILSKLDTLSTDNPVVMHEGPAILPRNREERWQHWSNKAIFDDAGEIVEIQSVGRDITERKKAEIALQESERELKKQASELEKKNIALREIMEQIGIEKKQIKDDVVANINEVLLPVLQKMKNSDPEMAIKYVELLERSLLDLTSSFGYKISDPLLKLTPREIEISNMIKTGFTTKEIANYLNVSPFTIESHRSNLRKKLHLDNEKINLTTYLHSL
jgi:PAS domain S-box-containing protein